MTQKMKDSGIKWIGMIPEGWNVLKLKSCYSFGKGLSITKADLCEQGLGVISYGQVHSKDNIGASVRESLIRYLPFDHVSLSDNSRVSINDLIFADTSEDLEGCGNCIFIDSENVKYAGYHTIILHPKPKETSRYFGYLFTTDAWKTQIRENASGVKVYSITQDMLKNAYLLAPPIATQHKVVSYLDAKCAEIDALIAAKEKSNTLLKEYRQSIIFEAVTKGLDPNVLMKDSGIEWIGMIPEGWGLERLKYHAVLNPNIVLPSLSDDSDVTFIPMDHLKKGYHMKSTTTYEKVKKGYVIFENNDILMAKVTPCLENGNLAIASQLINGIGFGSTEINVIRCKCIENKYLYYLLQCDGYINKATYEMYGVAGLKRLDPSFIPNSLIPIPPQSDQQRIVSFLDAKCAEIDTLIAANDKTISQLREYRQSVIFEAVTGKMEV